MSSDKSSFSHLRYLLLFLSFGLNLFFVYVYSYWNQYHKSPPNTVTYPTFRQNTVENSTILLLWFWPFGLQTDSNICSTMFNIDGCFLTGDRELYDQAHGVLINHRDINSDLSNLPTSPRPFFQKWIWMHFESPENTRKINGLDNLFNVTLNYRRDADIVLREQIMLKSEHTEDAIFPQVLDKKDKLVCWIMSNWNERHERAKFYNELKKHIDIYTLGRHFGKEISDVEYKETLTRCKFYLSFENTNIHYDYVTEKMFNPLILGAVPVALGVPRYIYERFVPEDAFIHVSDFPSAQGLAQHLLSLDKNVEEYKKYFEWRKHFEVKLVRYPAEHVCRACEYVRTKKDYQVFNNLNKWYWDPIDQL
ncbi:hypothetical protein DNTS_032919 [Danionella cerebrum]|uniref:Fucosyltransferase n=1 Tax=Danionella cerebrum TaxID=2873325 RepID=A0A553QJ27_9TELE|nr:hypothetical protein DNTS_032919 [Danionella translucida]